jgi:peptide/nickel transport system permease protein
MSNAKIIINEILPNVFPVIVVAMSTTVGWMILETAGLSFLGLGSQPPQADLGSMLGEARAAIITSPHTSVVPGVMILIIVMAINLVGDGIRDVLDPRLKSGALSTPRSTTEVAKNKSDAGLKTQTLLSINGLKTEFRIGNRILKAVNDVSLTVDKGQCVGIIGESGSGKSVTALSIMRLVSSPPGIITDGSIDFKGDDLLKLSSEDLRDFRGKKVSYVFQDPLSTLHPLYTVGQQLSEAIQSHNHVGKLEKHKKALELLQAVRISNPEKRLNSYPHELSGGMRQRIGIAMALANDPDIIIADEPTTALDVTVQAQILKLFQDLRREKGLALVFITHDFGVISQICDTVAVMYAGKIVETGPAAEILKSPAHPYTARLKSCVPELGQGKRNLIAIPGFPPMIDNMPSGCAFASRCGKAEQNCQSAMVDVKKIGQERAVRCLFPEEIKAG